MFSANKKSLPLQFRRQGFTLAEVLLTLMIIGVLALITLPGLFQDFDKLAITSSLTKNYAYINEALKLGYLKSECSDFDCYANYVNSDGTGLQQNFLEKTFVGGTYLGYYGNFSKFCPSSNCYLLNGDKATTLVQLLGSGYSCYVMRLKTGGLLLVHDSGFNPASTLAIVKNNGVVFLIIPGVIDKKSITVGRNLFSLKFKNDGTFSPIYDYPAHTCDTALNTSAAWSSCLSRIMKDGWKMRY